MPFIADRKTSFVPDEEQRSTFVADRTSSFQPDVEKKKTDFGVLASEFATGAVNEAFLGFPFLAIEKAGKLGKKTREALDVPSEIKAERVARGIGSVTGFVAGLPALVLAKGARAGIKAARLLPKAGRFTKAALKGAGAFGLLEAVKAPEKDFKEKLTTVPTATAIGAAGGAVFEAVIPPVVKGVSKLFGGVKKRIVDTLKRRPTKIIQQAIPDEKIPQQTIQEVENIKKRTLLNNELFTSEREFLKGQGKAAKELVRKLDAVTNEGEIRAGQAQASYIKLRKGMTTQELDNFVDVSEGRALPINDKVNKLVSFWKTQRDGIANEAVNLKLDVKSIRNSRGQKVVEVLNFKPRENHFPHMVISPDSAPKIINETLNSSVRRGDFKTIEQATKAWESYKAFAQSGKKGEAIFQYLVDKGQAQNKAEAERLMSTWIRRARQRRFGNLERARDINLPFWDTNPDRALPKYFNGAFNRLEEVRQLGLREEGAKGLIGAIRESGGDAKNAQVLFERWSGREPERFAFGALTPRTSQTVRGFQTITKLGLAAIPNSTQSINTAYVTGLKNTARGIRKSLTKEGQDFAIRTGAVLDSTIEDVIQRSTGGISGAARRFLGKVGFTATEQMNRRVAANAGREYALEMTRKLINNPASKSVRRALTEINLDPQTILNRGNVTFKELLLAGQKVVNKTQFRSGVLDLPLFFSSPEGRILTQFKNFAFNQTKLIKDALVMEVGRGNLKPIITAVALMPILGEGVKDVRAVLTGRSRDKEGLERIIENMSAVGGLGIISDLWQSASFRQLGTALAGPTISDLSDIGQSIVQVAKGRPKPLGKTAIKKIPVGGQFISNLLFPRERK